jgi:hypothetical protein
VVQPDGPPDPRARPGRRAVLALAAGVPVLAAGGCGALLPGERRTPRPLTPDELAVERAAADALRLRDAAAALAKRKGQPAALLRRLAADHDAHLEALGEAPVAGEVTAPPTATPAPPRDARDLRDAEWAAARAALRDAVAADDGLAALLVRIAASRVIHADAVAAGRAPAPPDRLDPAAAPKGTPAPSPAPSRAEGTAPEGAREALERLLAGEHAAVFAYPAVVARCAPNRRSAADALWKAHVAERDELERLLAESGDAPAAAPAYDIGEPPADPAAAAELAAGIERRLLATALAAVPPAAGDERLLAARRAVAAARRAAFWGAAATALPG